MIDDSSEVAHDEQQKCAELLPNLSYGGSFTFLPLILMNIFRLPKLDLGADELRNNAIASRLNLGNLTVKQHLRYCGADFLKFLSACRKNRPLNSLLVLPFALLMIVSSVLGRLTLPKP